MLGSRARVNLTRIRNGFLDERDFPALTAAASQLAAAPIYFDDTPAISIQELRAALRRLVAMHKVEVAFIDYLQLMRSMTKRGQDDRQLEVSEISSGIKSLAKELGIPIVVLAQLNRSVEARGMTGKPRLSDLRESGSIEQDADLVAFITRAEIYAEREIDRAALEGQAELIIAKQRSGPIGDIPLTFLKEFTRFESRRDGEEEHPTLPL